MPSTSNTIERSDLPILPPDWRWVQFSETCDRVSVGHVGPTTEFFTEAHDGICFLRSQNVRPGKLELDNALSITPEFHKKLKKSQLRAGDILFVRVGANRGDCCVVPSGVGELNCANIVFARPKHSTGFHAYFFQSDLGRNLLLSASVGAAQGVINTGSVATMPVPLPPLPVQQRIASILSAYDKLIENNQRRIKILETMARNLYREWFVHFRFPGHENHPRVDSSLGEIPQGWEVKTVKEFLSRRSAGEVYREAQLKAEGEVLVIDQSTSELLGFHDNVPDHHASPSLPIAIFGDHTCKMELLVEPFSIGPNVVPFVAGEHLPTSYVFYAVNSLVKTQEYKRHWSPLTLKEVVVADCVIAQRFASLIQPMLVTMAIHRKSIRNLRRTRDLLLPRLLSGQIPLPEAPDDLTQVTSHA